MTQATAELDATIGFAHDVQKTHPTTTPVETTEASATPGADDAFTSETTEASESKEVRVDDLAPTGQKLNELNAKRKQSTDSLRGRMRSIE